MYALIDVVDSRSHSMCDVGLSALSENAFSSATYSPHENTLLNHVIKKKYVGLRSFTLHMMSSTYASMANI